MAQGPGLPRRRRGHIMPSMAQLFGRYELLDRIGIGGMAEVFRAHVLGAGDFARMVVVKRMLPQLANENDSVMMFLDEARLGAKLHHPNIVSVLDLGEREGDYFMVLEHVDGLDLGTLDARIRSRGGRFPQEQAAWIIARAAEGLGAAHEANDPATGKPLNIVHRDVSPSNILVSRTAEVKVADFGVARSDAQHVRTSTGVLKGKIPYMSPEQMLEQPIDLRSDIYALGVVFWQLLAGRKRHSGRNDFKIIQTVVQEETPRPSSVQRDVDPQLEDIAMSMLARNREHRPATGWQVAQLLDQWLLSRQHTARHVERWLRETMDAPAAPKLHPPVGAAPEPRPLPSDLASATERSPLLRDAQSSNPTTLELSRWHQLCDQRLLHAPGCETRIVDGEAQVIVAARKLMHSLNGTATFIWDRADGQHSLTAIADELCHAFEVELPVAREEVLAFVLAAVESELLVLLAAPRR